MRTSTSVRQRLLNILGSIGYGAALFQWFWVAVVFLPSVLRSSFFQSLIARSDTFSTPSSPVIVPAEHANPFLALFALILALTIICMVVYMILRKVPRAVSDTGRTITHMPAQIIAPVILKHVHLSAKEKRLLPGWVILSTKLIVISLPVSLLAFAASMTLPVSFEIVMTIGFILFAWSFLSFAFQAILAKFLGIDYAKLR